MMKKKLLAVLGVVLMLAVPVYAQEGAETENSQTEEGNAQAKPPAMDAEMIGKILDHLGNEKFRETQKYFEDGGEMAEGYKGDPGQGLQQLLVDLGCGITVDGAVGAKTMEALHQVQESFGLEKSDKIDLSVYDTLLPLLLLKEGEDDTDVDLYAFYEEAVGSGYYDYLKGCLLAAAEKYYSAKEVFESCSYGDSQERAAACVQELPGTGELWRNPDIPGTDSSLTFTVNGSDDSRGMCFEMYNMDDQLVSVVFVRGSSSGTTYVPTGTYHIKDGSGSEWYGLVDTFGPDGYYEYLTFSEDPDTMYDAFLDYGQYELAINVSEIEEGATSVGSTGVGWNDTFGDIEG